MSDETEKPGEAQATPNRGRRREAPVIEGEAIAASEPREAEAAPPPEPPPARQRSSLAPVLPGLAALLLSGAALYFALNPATPRAASPEQVAALAERLDRLEQRLGAVEARPATQQPDLAPLEARLKALESRPAPQQADLPALTARIDAVEKTAAEAREDAAQAVREAQAIKPPEAPKVDLGPLEQRLSKLEADVNAQMDALTAPKTQVRATEAPDVPGVASNDAPALAVAAESLRQQLDRGAPFAREVTALEKLGAEPDKLSKLKPLAATGAPSAARLAQDLQAVSGAMLRAARPAPANGDLMDRLARSAASLVRIRPAGETAGEDAPALVSRIEAALQRGDVAGALAAYDRLPAKAKDPAKDWAARARQRVEADAAAHALIDEALDKLARK